MSTVSVALTGNPNTGKSTIFNTLTGARQKIGNWPGVTVDKRTGWLNYAGRAIAVVDLPGTYSVNARSPEEKIVSDFFATEKPDFIVDVIDSTNIERNLFLTVQLLERGIPLLLALNMTDEAETKGIKISRRAFEEAVGMPVMMTVGKSFESMKQLLDVFTSSVMQTYEPSEELKAHIAKVEAIAASGAKDADEQIAAARYEFIGHVMEKAVVYPDAENSLSDKIDSVLANGVLALPILFAIIYGVFEITFTHIGQPLADMLDELIGEGLTPWAEETLEAMSVSPWLKSLVVDGIIGGVGGVLTFVPLIFTLFFCLSFLDGTGYMARVAFIMDPIMRRVGLSGKGVMPLIMGFGCGVPAIMGARALDSNKDRMISILVTPFLTCGAKLPVMALFAAMFFPQNAADVVFMMYVAGVIMAIIMAKVLYSTTFADEESTFLLELPPYRMPDMRSVLLETWDKGKGYLVKAGTIIFAMSVVIWALSNFNMSGMTEEMNESFLAMLGAAMSNLFAFHGFATWESGAAVLTGILAKEAVVSTMGILYGVAEISTEAEDAIETATQLSTTMGAAFTMASALAFMVFSQLYTPCVTALGTIKKETGSWKWVGFAAGYTFAAAWVVSLIVYQVMVLLGYNY